MLCYVFLLLCDRDFVQKRGKKEFETKERHGVRCILVHVLVLLSQNCFLNVLKSTLPKANAPRLPCSSLKAPIKEDVKKVKTLETKLEVATAVWASADPK